LCIETIIIQNKSRRNTKMNKFVYENFSCDVDIFRNDDNMVIRFYDASGEHTAEQMVNTVIADSGYGFLCFKRKGDDGLVSGFLCGDIFSSDEIIEAAIEFSGRLSSDSWGYVPHHVDRVKIVNYVEYNGEY